MPTRLEVLLQRRKSAAAGLFHRHRKASTSAGSKPAVRRAANRSGRWDLVGIIQRSYIKSLTISREPAGAVNGQGGIFGRWAADMPLVTAVFELRYGKICDNSHLIPVFWAK